jgi:hypothetical protein
VGSKSIRTLLIMGILAVLAMTFLMMFSLDQMTDTQTPLIAQELASELSRSLQPEPPASVRLTMFRKGKGLDAPRTYTLRIRPNAAIAADEKILPRLLYRAAELCAVQLGDMKSDVTIRCIATLPEGGEKEASYVMQKHADAQGLALIREATPEEAAAALPPPAPVETATR